MKRLFAGLFCAAALQSQAAERVIEKDVVVRAKLDKAWAAWRTREGIVSFFASDAVIEPSVGGAFHIHLDPG